MSPILRNAAIATGLTLLPAALGAAWYANERPRSLPERVSARMRHLFNVAPEPENTVERIARRLDQLQSQLDSQGHRLQHQLSAYGHDAAALARATTPKQRSVAGVIVALLVPAVLLPILFPERAAELRDRARTWLSDEEEEQVEREIARVAERLDSLSNDIEAQRGANFDTVAQAAQKERKG